MAWLLVLVAGVFETGFAVLMKQSHGITRVWPTAGFALCALISFGLLTIALRKLEVGPAYAVWTGIGASATCTDGVYGTVSRGAGGRDAVDVADSRPRLGRAFRWPFTAAR